MNFGAFATPERNVVFDINDFDETLPAPWEWDLKRLAASVVIAGRHLKLSDNDSPRAAIATVRSYREHIADSIDAGARSGTTESTLSASSRKRQLKSHGERIEERVEQTRSRTVPEHDYPKMVEHHGVIPQIKDNPPLIFHPSAEMAPGIKTGYHEAIGAYRGHCPSMYECCSTAFTFAIWHSKRSAWVASAPVCRGLFLAADDDPLFLRSKRRRPRGSSLCGKSGRTTANSAISV